MLSKVQKIEIRFKFGGARRNELQSAAERIERPFAGWREIVGMVFVNGEEGRPGLGTLSFDQYGLCGGVLVPLEPVVWSSDGAGR